MFDLMQEDDRIQRLSYAPKQGKVAEVVLDTDTYNEIDDQYAIVYSLLAKERVKVEAIYAAPFFNERSTGPRDGMEKSYDEILRILDLMNVDSRDFAFKGSPAYLLDTDRPVRSEAADHLVALAREHEETPLYVLAMGAVTTVASAILMEPDIIRRIVVLWLGGNPLYWPSNAIAFNLVQDILSARILFDSGVPLIHFPCLGVTSHLHTTQAEMERYVRGHGKIGDYLYRIFSEYTDDHFGFSKVLWDMVVVAFMINPSWTPSELIHSPIVTDQKTYSVDTTRHFIRNIAYVDRDPIFRDFFARLAKI